MCSLRLWYNECILHHPTQLVVADWNANQRITCFSDLAEQLIGHSAAEIGKALEFEREKAESYLSKLAFRTFVFKMRTKHEFYGDVSRPKTTAVAAGPIRHKERNAYLIKDLQRMMGIEKMM